MSNDVGSDDARARTTAAAGVGEDEGAAPGQLAETVRDTRFQKGVSGNPSGRPKGARNKATMVAEALLDGDAEGLMQACIEQGLAGDRQALRLCVERLLPRRHVAPVGIDLPEITCPNDVAIAHGRVLKAVTDGDLTIGDGEALMKLIDRTSMAFGTTDWDGDKPFRALGS